MKEHLAKNMASNRSTSVKQSAAVGAMAAVPFIVLAGLLTGCSDSKNDSSGPAAAESGSSTVLGTGLKSATGVAVRDQTAWVTEGQLDHYVGGNTTPPDPFEVVSVPLAGGGKGSDSIALPGDDFYPEGITAAADGTLYVGSLKTGQIEKVPAGTTTAMEFVAAGVLQRGALGMKVDAARGLLWVCDSDPGEDMPGADVVGIDLTDATEKVRHAMTATSLCNDIVVDGVGNVWATDTFGGAIYKIAAADALTANHAAIWLQDHKFDPNLDPDMMLGFGVNGLAMLGKYLFASNTSGGYLMRMDPASTSPASTLEILSLTEDGAPLTLSGPDAVEPLSANELLVVENGFRVPHLSRLIKITLNAQ